MFIKHSTPGGSIIIGRILHKEVLGGTGEEHRTFMAEERYFYNTGTGWKTCLLFMPKDGGLAPMFTTNILREELPKEVLALLGDQEGL